jgi:hypothetical protein
VEIGHDEHRRIDLSAPELRDRSQWPCAKLAPIDPDELCVAKVAADGALDLIPMQLTEGQHGYAHCATSR